jgi:predicted anti-sigma-YlaC factor YlaD
MKKHISTPVSGESAAPASMTVSAFPAVKVLLTAAVFVLLGSCSINKMATSMVADALSSPGGSSVFASDPDPELVRDALPFALKMYESLLESTPEHRPLLESTAEGFISYANAFVHTPATRLDYDEIDRQKDLFARARALYLRGCEYALRSLEVEYPGFQEAFRRGEGVEQLREMEEEDVNALYWAAAGWMGAVSAAGFDTAMLMELPRPIVLAARALQLNEKYGQGAIHNLFIDIYGGVPAEQMLYGNTPSGEYSRGLLKSVYEAAGMSAEADMEEKARFHFRRTVQISEGSLAGPYVSLAGSVSIRNQDAEEYRELLEEALAIDVDARPESRMVNLLTQEKARWMLEHMEDYFLILEDLPE